MKLIVPCKLGDERKTLEGIKQFIGVTWFKWSDGMEFTYFYRNSEKWGTAYFETEKSPEYDMSYDICDNLLQDDFLKDKGYPVKGRGYIYGLKMINNELYAELLLTDKYFAHIYVQCDEQGIFREQGKIYVPPSWDTEEKKRSILLSKYSKLDVLNIRL